jgi:UDP-N-acetylglucosamine--N-acetylmuramyl-(pentapeptide) pyrophosphoryl-undecaprenol N-acetylglucosamine transferase
MKTRGTMVLCAGGTGGHLFPAEALAHELAGRGWDVHLATDERAQRYAANFPAKKMHVIASSTPSGKNPVRLAVAGLTLLRGYRQARMLLASLKPAAVIGFGGYPTVPPMLAATRMGIPSIIHDANAVMGRANRLLAPRVDLIAMGFEGVEAGANTLVTGNPVRPAVIEASKMAYPLRQAGEPFNLLVFGGSQGAQFFSQALPQAIELLPPEKRSLLRLVQQARPEDEGGVKAAYAALGVQGEVAPFFTDMAKRIASAHFIVSRAGASTVSELAAIGRPSLLVPYPHALDHDQALNARTLEAGGGASIVEQATLSTTRLAEILDEAMSEPQRLAEMAAQAKRSGRPDAAARLADSLEKLASKNSPKGLKELP